MPSSLTRRRLLGLGATVVSGGALAAAGFGPRKSSPQAPPDEIVVIHEADPAARPFTYRSASGVAYRHAPTPTSTPTPTPTNTPTPTPTPRPRAVARPAWNSDLLRQVTRSGPAGRPQVALTIDDGWSHRDAVLKVLKEKQARLSLFLAGRCIAGDRGFVARALDAGCEIANHTMDHYNLTDKSAAYIQKDLYDFEELVKAQVAGATTLPYMRPSGGSLNQTVIDASAAAGYRPVLWSASAGDGSASTTPDQMVRYILAGAKPGAILLMHFGERAVTALPAMIDGLRARGLEPVSLSKLFESAPS